MTLIAQLSDLHIRPRGVPALRVVETNRFADRAIDAIIALKPRPDAVLMTGDLIDRWLEAEYELAREILGRSPVPVYLLAGNHDDAAMMRRVFGDYPGVAEAPEDRVRYRADIGALTLIALDSSVPGKSRGELGPDQLAWLDETLADASDRPVIIAVHHPPFASGIGFMDRIGLRDADALRLVIERHGNVVRVLCGHQHRAVTTTFAGTIAMIAPGTAHQVTLSLQSDHRDGFILEPPAYLLHQWSEAGLVSHLAYIEPYEGPYPFRPAEGFQWP